MSQKVDLTNCDREPIHIPGLIQPHGCLIVLNSAGQIVQASANTPQLLGASAPVIGGELSSIINPGDAGEVAKSLSVETLHAHPVYLRSIRSVNGEGVFDAIAHRIGENVVLELEPRVAPSIQPVDIHRNVQLAIAGLRGATSLRQLVSMVAGHVRELTGFDRVMIYQFDNEWNGEVVSEEKREDLEGFLGLHYPASDIPKQARELYEKNWLRFIADRDYVPVPVEPTLNPATRAPLDMSFCVLRSVSPIHLEYLRNMGVGASMSISLLRGGKLWGLIACHHYSPRYVPYELRSACELLAQVVSLQVAEWEQRELADGIALRRQLKERLLQNLEVDDGFAASLSHMAPTLLSYLDAGGAAVVAEDKITRIGQTPSEAVISEIVDRSGIKDCASFATDRVSELLQSGRSDPIASGVLVLSLSRRMKQLILWFRPEQSRVVRWAGDPAKSVTKGDGGEVRLSPRGSFSLWKETVRGRSIPWTPAEIASAEELRREILDKLLTAVDDLARHNELLRRARDEKEQMLATERAARSEAERVNRMKDDFVAVLSHELRTPLTAIRGWSQLLLSKSSDNPQLSKGLEVIVKNAKSQSQMIEDLLDISRIASGKLRLDVQPVDLPAVVQAAVGTVELAAKAKDIRVVQFIDPMTEQIVTGDPHRLQQVVWNLLSNAVKFTPKGGKIRVELKRVNSHVELSVNDTGPGIPADFLPHVFDRFRQADASTSRQHGGLGLGLSIVRHLVELHGGSVAAESPGQGQGATFTVTLPMRAVSSKNDTVAANNSSFLDCASLHLDGLQVLVVDDEHDTREMLKSVLEECKINVTTAEGVAAAMLELYEKSFDVLISDIGMPNSDGYNLIQQLRAFEKQQGRQKLPAIALTAYARAEDRQRTMLSGFQVHLAKPVEPAELLAVVASLAGRI